MYLVYTRNLTYPMGYGWEPLPYAPRSLREAIKLLQLYRNRQPERTFVLGRNDAFGRPQLDVDSELRITERLCEPITHTDVFEMCG